MGTREWSYRRPRPKARDFPRRGKGSSLAQVTRAVIDRKIPREAQRFCEIFDNWHKVVGARMAARSCPSILRRQTLFVDLRDHQWAHDMRYMQKTILSRIASLVGPGQILSLRCRVCPADRFRSHAQRLQAAQDRRNAWREMHWPVKQNAPLARQAPSNTDRLIASLKHDSLREAALRWRDALATPGSSNS